MAEKFTVSQFIDAIPNTGGIVSTIARKIGCDWHTARKYIDEHPTVKLAWDDERKKISDVARHNIIGAIHGGDLAMSRWWLQVMEQDEFNPPTKLEHTGEGGGAVKVQMVEVLLPPEDDNG